MKRRVSEWMAVHSVEDLLQAYKRQVELPWLNDVAAGERVWILWYDKGLERRVQMQPPTLESMTASAGHGWRDLCLSKAFGQWVSKHPYFEALLESPDELSSIAPEFEEHVAGLVRAELEAATADDVVALFGAASLFGIGRVSSLIVSVAPAIRGRLLVAFPGQHASGVYRLLDARDGWNYRAVPIPPQTVV